MVHFARHAPLAPLTTLGLGGSAHELCSVDAENDLVDAVREADEAGVPVLLLGEGSNLVVADDGFPGRVVQIRTRGVSVVHDGGDTVLLSAAAGEHWDTVVERSVAEGLSGIECLSGVPGLVGATPIQNVGAYGQEVADTLTTVSLWDRRDRTTTTFAREECGFAYRDSVFKTAARGRYVVLGATFALSRGRPRIPRYAELVRALGATEPTLAVLRQTVLALRRRKSMVVDPNDPESRSVGSFFTNPVVTEAVTVEVARRARALGVLGPDQALPAFPADAGRTKLAAAWLIERAGIARGSVHGGVAVSRKHSLALVHLGGGSSAQLVELARHIRATVHTAFGIALTPEPVFAGFASDDPVSQP